MSYNGEPSEGSASSSSTGTAVANGVGEGVDGVGDGVLGLSHGLSADHARFGVGLNVCDADHCLYSRSAVGEFVGIAVGVVNKCAEICLSAAETML